MKLLFILLGLGGLGAISYGAWLVHPAVGWIVSGIATLVVAQGWNRVYNSRRK